MPVFQLAGYKGLSFWLRIYNVLLGPGVIVATERQSYPKVMHLQLNYCNKLGYGFRVQSID